MPPQILLESLTLCSKVRELPQRDFSPLSWCNIGWCCVFHSLQCTCGCGGVVIVGRWHGRYDNCQHRTSRRGRWLSGLIIYADGGAIGYKDHKWLQNVIQHICNLFKDCTGLKPNTEKTETMSCHPRAIRNGARLKAINVVMKVPEKLTPREKGKELCVPLPLVEKPWH